MSLACWGITYCARYNLVLFLISIFISYVVRWSDGMRYCKSDLPGLCLFCCHQPSYAVSHRVDFGLLFFLFHKFSTFITPILFIHRISFFFTPPPRCAGEGHKAFNCTSRYNILETGWGRGYSSIFDTELILGFFVS